MIENIEAEELISFYKSQFFFILFFSNFTFEYFFLNFNF